MFSDIKSVFTGSTEDSSMDNVQRRFEQLRRKINGSGISDFERRVNRNIASLQNNRRFGYGSSVLHSGSNNHSNSWGGSHDDVPDIGIEGRDVGSTELINGTFYMLLADPQSPEGKRWVKSG